MLVEIANVNKLYEALGAVINSADRYVNGDKFPQKENEKCKQSDIEAVLEFNRELFGFLLKR